jgi:hypothetical protein
MGLEVSAVARCDHRDEGGSCRAQVDVELTELLVEDPGNA